MVHRSNFSMRRPWLIASLLGILSSFVLGLILHNSFVLVTDKTNAIEASRSIESVRGAVAASTKSVTGVNLDNSVWDEAVTRAYAPSLDLKWFYDTWGAVSATGENYDVALLVDERSAIVLGYVAGAPAAPRLPADWVRRQFGHLPSADAPLTGLVDLGGRPAMAAINLIQPVSGKLGVLHGRRRYLVFARFLTPEVLAPYSAMFSLKNVKLARAAGSQPSLSLTALNGEPLGVLSWKPRQPGEEAARAAGPELLVGLVLVIALVAALLTGITIVVRRLLRSEERSRRAARTDALSGLPNRRAFLEELDRLSRRGKDTAVLLIDLDGFKDVNDAYGHEAGDELIIALSRLFASMLPETAFLSRLGGDEFAALIHGADAGHIAESFASRIVEALETPVRLGARLVQAGASLGIAALGPEGRPMGAELLRRADVALYAAKAAGKGHSILYVPELDAVRQEAKRIEDDIRHGLDHDEFEIIYQGIYDVHTHEFPGVEALLRWPRRPSGPLSPTEFIPIAEQSGLIHEIGLFVLERACRDWNSAHTCVSVNVSPSQFRDPLFETHVARILDETGFPPHRLELELTEGYLIDRPLRAKQAIDAFKALGIRVALDDFGTGYTSIVYLQSYGFDKIKLDKSLIDHIADDPKAAVLVQGAMFMANGLSMQVTAEGVETAAQAKLLEIAGCHLLQGYHYSRPMPLGEIKAWMRPEVPKVDVGTPSGDQRKMGRQA